jgi:drug/metabolite transporter (DMT)-like permease
LSRVQRGDYGYTIPLVAASIIWGSSFIAIKVGVTHVDPVLFALVRYGFASMAVLPLIFLFKEFDWRFLRNPLIWGLALLNAVAMNLQNIGMTMTTVTNSVLLIDINVVYIAVLAAFVLKERLTPKIIVGLLLGIVGVLIISTNGDLSSVGGGTFTGNIFVLAAGLIWSVYVVYLTKTLQSGASMVSSTMGLILLTTVFMVPFTIFFAKDWTMDTTGWEMAAYTGIFCTTIAFTLYSYGLKGLGATITSVILLMEIVFGMLFAIILLDEIPTIITAIGGAFILIAVIVISFRWKKEKERSKAVQE